MSKATPGPWEFVDSRKLTNEWSCYSRGETMTNCDWRPIVASDGSPIAFVVDEQHWSIGRRSSFDADARLIASAPDLLAAAKQARKALSAPLMTRDTVIYSDALRALNAAIKKSEA